MSLIVLFNTQNRTKYPFQISNHFQIPSFINIYQYLKSKSKTKKKTLVTLQNYKITKHQNNEKCLLLI